MEKLLVLNGNFVSNGLTGNKDTLMNTEKFPMNLFCHQIFLPSTD